MQAIVLEILERKLDSMNGRSFLKYQFKLLHHDTIYQCDGFTYDLEAQITTGDIIEDMEVIGHLTKEALCKAYYHAKQAAAANQPLITHQGIWFPARLGEIINIDGNKGRVYGVINSFPYIPGYTWLIEWEKDLGITTGKRLRYQLGVTGAYVNAYIMPGDKAEISKYIPALSGPAQLWGIYYDPETNYYTYQFQYQGKEWEMVEYSTHHFIEKKIILEPSKQVIKQQAPPQPKQMDLFAFM